MPSFPGVTVRKSELWSPEQYVHASAFERAQRVSLGKPAQVADLRALSRQEGDWRPSDYRLVPTQSCHEPGYTLLEDVFVTMPGLVLTGDGRFVNEAFARITPKHLSPTYERILSTTPAVRAAEWPVLPQAIEKGILLAGTGSAQYGHMLLDFLPPVSVLDHLEVLPDWPLLMPARTPPWLDAMVQAFGGRARTIVRFPRRMGVKVKVGRLCVPWVLRQSAFHPAAGEAFDRIVRTHAASGRGPSGSPTRRIYIERPPPANSSTKRQLTNADEARAFFQGRGFEPIRPELLPFADQIRLFAGARAVAGEAGSGLHGTVFSEPGITAIELRPPSFTSRAQLAIAALRQQGLVSIQGAQESKVPMSHDPWTLDLDQVEQRLSALGPL
jgi:capsular polysaccharide biosynthesis protein